MSVIIFPLLILPTAKGKLPPAPRPPQALGTLALHEFPVLPAIPVSGPSCHNPGRRGLLCVQGKKEAGALGASGLARGFSPVKRQQNWAEMSRAEIIASHSPRSGTSRTLQPAPPACQITGSAPHPRPISSHMQGQGQAKGLEQGGGGARLGDRGDGCLRGGHGQSPSSCEKPLVLGLKTEGQAKMVLVSCGSQLFKMLKT